jgi:hypothetical protein
MPVGTLFTTHDRSLLDEKKAAAMNAWHEQRRKAPILTPQDRSPGCRGGLIRRGSRDPQWGRYGVRRRSLSPYRRTEPDAVSIRIEHI